LLAAAVEFRVEFHFEWDANRRARRVIEPHASNLERGLEQHLIGVAESSDNGSAGRLVLRRNFLVCAATEKGCQCRSGDEESRAAATSSRSTQEWSFEIIGQLYRCIRSSG